MKSRLKAVSYAICTVMTGGFGRITTGSKMVIAGYKLRNHALKGEKCLVLESQYIPEYEDHGEQWVVDMIEEKAKKKKVVKEKKVKNQKIKIRVYSSVTDVSLGKSLRLYQSMKRGIKIKGITKPHFTLHKDIHKNHIKKV